jgi:hypothetical protein
MAMQNIDLFDEYVAAALASLYESFPIKRFLDARALCGHADIDDYGAIVDDSGRPSKAFEVARATIEWLVETGYVRAGQRHPWGYSDSVLTAAGLEVLKASPESLKAKETLGEKLVRFSREGSVGLAKEAAKAAITTGIGMLPRVA